MSTQTIPTATGHRSNILLLAATATGAVGIVTALVVAGAIALSPTLDEVNPQVPLRPIDDYYFRHLPAPAAVGPMDDYYFRHLKTRE